MLLHFILRIALKFCCCCCGLGGLCFSSSFCMHAAQTGHLVQVVVCVECLWAGGGCSVSLRCVPLSWCSAAFHHDARGGAQIISVTAVTAPHVRKFTTLYTLLKKKGKKSNCSSNNLSSRLLYSSLSCGCLPGPGDSRAERPCPRGRMCAGLLGQLGAV